jgi:Skp family chaperone for outer membrane proteins
MTKFTMLLAAAALVAPAMASAQVGGIAVANPDQAIGASRAWTTARTQIETTYKAQLDQAQARRDAIARELQPQVTALQTASAAPNANQAALQTQANAIRTREQAGQAELSRLTAPAQRAQQFAIEQISNRLPEAVQNVVRARSVSLLLRPDAALFAQPAADVTPAITAELDRLVPSVGITPPAGWQPGQQQQGAVPAATGTAPAATTVPAATGARPATRSSGR